MVGKDQELRYGAEACLRGRPLSWMVHVSPTCSARYAVIVVVRNPAGNKLRQQALARGGRVSGPSADLQSMLDHGVENPMLSFYDFFDWASYKPKFHEIMNLRQELGITSTTLYLADQGTKLDETLDALETRIEDEKSAAAEHGVTELYVYGIDEATGTTLDQEQARWELVHSLGVKVFVAGSPDMPETARNNLDLLVSPEGLDQSWADLWHGTGDGHRRIVSYANPQAGWERPELYRRNYGLLLWQNNYDGVMTWDYQGTFGNPWNDFDDGGAAPLKDFKDSVFTYPTVDGLVETRQWEGFREAADDLRYLATLQDRIARAPADNPHRGAAEAWLKDLRAADLLTRDLHQIRSEIIEHILGLPE